MAEKDDRVQVLHRMPPELVELLDEEAKRWDRPRNWLIEHACKTYLRQLKASRDRRRRKG